MNGIPTRVFISYSHDGQEHEERVLDLADRLREDGIDAEVDLYVPSPPEGWPAWCERQIDTADFVLMVCTETYHRRVKGGEALGRGLGVVWEARIIRQLVYDSGAVSQKFIPLLFSDGSADHIPLPAKGWTRYVVDTEDGYEALYRRLTDQPWTTRPPVGSGRQLPARPPRHRPPAAGLGGKEKVRSGVGDKTKPISLFYSYSHKDEELRLKLQDHLAALKWSGMIAEWNDRDIEAGKEWEREIDHHLSSADIILLLVSASFIASEYCWSVEIKKALERHERGEARVIPVILKPCRWQRTPFAKLQATPKDAKPVTQWLDWDAAFDDVVSKIEAVVDELQRSVGQAAEAAGDGEPKAGSQVGGGLIMPPLAFVDFSTSGVSNRLSRALIMPPLAFVDFSVFRDIDAPWCPEMVALPVGEFLMGSPEREEGRSENEGPQHWVTIDSRFAIGRYPVTFAEYDHFCDVTKREKPEDQGWGRGRQPVINVSWHDAQAYCEWLAKETGKPYRLLSEAEWEYACRVGTTTPFSFGATISTSQANYDGNYTYGKGTKGDYRQRTTEVRRFLPNPWGLYDMHGNVWELVEDVWHTSYDGAPADGSAWTDGEGKESFRGRVIRGGSWGDGPRYLRSAERGGGGPDGRDSKVGFRVVGTLG